VSLGSDVLRRAADLPLDDDPESWSPWHEGHGLVRAVKQAAGLGDGEWTDGQLTAYYAAMEPLLGRLEPLVKRGSLGTAELSPLKQWAKNKSAGERRDLLLSVAKEVQ
jgi:hypothetical protein